MPAREVGYLGPPGTYSHLVAQKRYGPGCRMIPLPTVLDVCTFVSGRAERRGVVPIENSSGGAVYETVDILLAGKPRVCILEELALNVNLALLGRKGEKIRTLYSHFIPLEHCSSWLRRHLPRVEKRVVASTALAAQQAWQQAHAAALAGRALARLWHLEVLEYPVQADIPNITVFLAIGGGRIAVQPRSAKTTLAVKLPNRPGSLCTFLEAFRDEQVNLSRLISRPLRGSPREYTFLVDIEGSPRQTAVKRALQRARRVAVEVRFVGAFPSRRKYTS